MLELSKNGNVVRRGRKISASNCNHRNKSRQIVDYTYNYLNLVSLLSQLHFLSYLTLA